MKAEPLRLLVVDDNPADRFLYRIALMASRGAAFELFEVDEGKAALDYCRAQRPDCILLDFNLPAMDGLHFLSLLKEQHGDLPCAVVMLTGVGDASVAVRAMKSGIADYLRKSENIGEILAQTVLGAVEKFRMRREIAEQQAALEASELQYRTLMESLPQLVWLADSSGNIQYANRRWSEYTGLTAAGGFDLREAILEEDRARFSEVWEEAAGANRGFEIDLRLCRSADRADRWHLIRFVPMEHGAGEARWLGTAMDIEEVKQAEKALQTKQKWESIGLLAGSIAHDFNNLLVGIMGGATLLAEGISDPEQQSLVKLIVDSSERAAHLTRQLLAYSGKGNYFVKSVDLPSLVREACDLIRPSIPESVQVSIEVTGPVPAIVADPGQMQQVIMNLVMNAVEAIPEKQTGNVSVRAFAGDFSKVSAAGDGTSEISRNGGACAVLEVQDTGLGMEAETQAKMFDPFFTTKFLGRGLGLAAVHGIVRSAQGRIVCDSAPGKGTTIRVFLPASHVPAWIE